MKRWMVVISIVLSMPILTAPAVADWLVMSDGHRLETRGPWRVEGNLVLFEQAEGGLASIRLSEVDLEASQKATEEADRPATSPAAERSRPKGEVFVLTDADVRHVTDQPSTATSDEDGEASEGEEAAAEPAETKRLVVTDWDEEEDPEVDGLVLTGTLRNVSADTTGSVQLTVNLFDLEGASLATGNAELSAVSLPPRSSARFRAEFPGIYEFSGARFDTRSIDFVTAVPPGVAEGLADEDELADEEEIEP